MVAERLANGQFAKNNQVALGHKGAGGRPSRPVEEAYLRAIKEAMPSEAWVKCLRVYAARAQSGDRYALRFFADYLLGKPLERRELTGLHGQPLGIIVTYASDNPDPS